MDLQEKMRYLQLLDDALGEAGLPADISSVIGHKFIFVNDDRRTRKVACGTVTGIELEGNVQRIRLRVSTPYFGNLPLLAIVKNVQGWAAQTSQVGGPVMFDGDLVFLL